MISRQWCFTLFRGIGTHASAGDPLERMDSSKVIFGTWQVERCPRTQRLHVQGVVKFKQAMRMTGVKAWLNDQSAHLEICRDWNKSIEYCTKEETRVEGPWSMGTRATEGSGKRSDLMDCVELMQKTGSVRRVASEFPSAFVRYHKGLNALKVAQPNLSNFAPKKVVLLCGSTGVGKTFWAMARFRDIFTVPDIKNPWFDGYDGHQVALLDECGKGMMHYNYFKRITDVYVMDVPVKGGHVKWNPSLVILTTNAPMREWWDNVPDADAAALNRRIVTFEFFGHVNPAHDVREWNRLDAHVADLELDRFDATIAGETPIGSAEGRPSRMIVDDSEDDEVEFRHHEVGHLPDPLARLEPRFDDIGSVSDAPIWPATEVDRIIEISESDSE